MKTKCINGIAYTLVAIAFLFAGTVIAKNNFAGSSLFLIPFAFILSLMVLDIKDKASPPEGSGTGRMIVFMGIHVLILTILAFSLFRMDSDFVSFLPAVSVKEVLPRHQKWMNLVVICALCFFARAIHLEGKVIELKRKQSQPEEKKVEE